MNNTQLLEVQEIIKKNLPSQVGEVLRERLEQAEKESVELFQLKETVIKKITQLQTLKNELKNTNVLTTEMQLLK